MVSIPTLDGGTSDLRFGALIGAILTFLIVAAVVYFVFVLPMNTLKEHTEAKRKAGEPASVDEPEDELALLSQIRDLLAANSASGKHSE